MRNLLLTISYARTAAAVTKEIDHRFMDTTTSIAPLDITHCDTELIRYCGAIQPHGALLVLDSHSGWIEAASESCQTLMGLSPHVLLGQSIGEVFGQSAQTSLLSEMVDSTRPLVPLLVNGQAFSARPCLGSDGQRLIDIELCPSNDAQMTALTYSYRQGVEALSRLGGVLAVAQAAAELIRELTDFDQVMIYRFDVQWNGEVIAEALAPGIEPYLGLNFPASDIPKQARELFRLCRVRLIPDACYTPSALLAKGDARSIDLGRSSLRSVSPIHIEYLKNMGARATLVGALVIEDQLWGLVSCQQKNEPKYFNQVERDIVSWLCQDIAALIEIRAICERSDFVNSLAVRRSKLIDAVRANKFNALICTDNNSDLLEVVGADGFALLIDDAIQVTGITPAMSRIMALYQRRLEVEPHATLFSTNALCSDLGMEAVEDGVAGALFVSVLRKPVVTMIWFRRERHYSLHWGGDPQHPHFADESGRISPRKSFDRFLQEANGQALAWLPEELASAVELVSLIEIMALHEREAFAKTIQNSMPAHISVLDTKGVIITVNNAWKQFAQDNDAPDLAQTSLGVSYRDVCATAVGQPNGDEAGAAWAGIEAVLNKQLSTFSLDYPCDSPTQKRWFRMCVHPMTPPATGAVVVHENITQRKLTEIALAHSEAHMKAAQQIASLGSWEWDVATGDHQWSDQQCRIFGYSPDSIHPNSDFFFRALHPDDQDKVRHSVEQMLEDDTPHNVEYRIIRPNGDIRHVHARGEVERDTSGKPVRMAGTVLDITERILTHRRLDILLAEQKALLENDLFGIMVLQNRKIIWTNPAFEKMLGYNHGELIGTDARLGHPSDVAYQAFEAAVYAQLVKDGIFRGETEYVRKDGKPIWVDVSGSKLDATSDKSHWWFVDITERKQADISLVAAKEAAEAANIAKSRFLATMSHEIRTPMNGILGMANILLVPDLKDADRQSCAKTILNSGQTLMTLLNDFLDIAKIESGNFKPEVIVFDDRKLMQEVQVMYAESAIRKGLAIEFNAGIKDGQRFMGDPNRLRQMISNLVSNAIKFTPQGSIRVESHQVTRDTDTAVIEYSVTDTGIGVPVDKQTLLFKPFSQTDSSMTRRYGGSGLGLSIVQSMAILMDGEVGVSSELGQGSRFWFRVRVGLVSPRQSDGQQQASDSVPMKISLAKLSGHVLVVDDNKSDLDVIRELLLYLGLKVTCAEDGFTGVLAMTQGGSDTADLILMDVRMPNMDGYEATTRIRQWEQKTGQIRHPIIALTASVFEEDRRQCVIKGMDGFIAKPIISVDALAKVLAQWLPAKSVTQVSQSSSAPATLPVDVIRVREILCELEPLLAKNKFSAIDTFNELQAAVTGTVLEHDIAEIRWFIEELQFEQALPRLRGVDNACAAWIASKP
jgi:PAS domain S-box-containing protein